MKLAAAATANISSLIVQGDKGFGMKQWIFQRFRLMIWYAGYKITLPIKKIKEGAYRQT